MEASISKTKRLCATRKNSEERWMMRNSFYMHSHTNSCFIILHAHSNYHSIFSNLTHRILPVAKRGKLAANSKWQQKRSVGEQLKMLSCFDWIFLFLKIVVLKDVLLTMCGSATCFLLIAIRGSFCSSPILVPPGTHISFGDRSSLACLAPFQRLFNTGCSCVAKSEPIFRVPVDLLYYQGNIRVEFYGRKSSGF